ncbi:hypothetical protein J132_02167 [Termitomyces sp. J132]|nr:hypothetical protein J132_02167 [Termitomyces sp. J132]
MPDSLISTFAQGSTVGGFLVNIPTVGHNAIFHRTTEVPIHLKSAQSKIQKIRDDIRNYSAYLNRREMIMFTNHCNKCVVFPDPRVNTVANPLSRLCDQVETQLQDYYREHLIKRYYLTSGVAITKALELNKECRKLYELVWATSTDAKANKERQLGLNFVEKSQDVLSDCEPPLDDSSPENEESPSEPPNTVSNLQDSSLPTLRFVLPPRITPWVMFPDTGSVRMSLPKFFATKSIPAPEATFELATLNSDGHANIQSTSEENANE